MLTCEFAAVNYTYGLESSRNPSYISCSFGGVRASSGSPKVLEAEALKSTTVTKTETVVIENEEKKDEQEKKEEKEEEKKKEEQVESEESAAVEKKEQVEEEVKAVAEE